MGLDDKVSAEYKAKINSLVYRLRKGATQLVLETTKADKRDYLEERLQRSKIDYHIVNLSNGSMNVYFGKNECVDVVRSFGTPLSKYTPEQHFILGAMLGYDLIELCEFYLKKT